MDDIKTSQTTDDFKQVETTQYQNDVKKSYIPEGFDSVEDFLSDMRDEYDKDVAFDDDNRREAIDDKKFASGEQWDQDVLQQRKGLPCLTINSIPQFVAQLVGDWRENKNGIKVLPMEDGDVDKATIRSDLVRAIQTSSRSDRVFDNAFESMVTCGDGAFRVSVEYAKNNVFDQDIFLRQIDDSLSVVWDRFSSDPTGRDATRVHVNDWMSKKEFRKKWKDIPESTLGERERSSLAAGGWLNQDGVRITEYWRLIERTRLLCLFEDGSMRFIDGDNPLDELTEKHGAPTKTRMAPVTYAQMHLVTGFDILAGPYEYQLNRVPIIRMSGRTTNIEGRRIRFGLVRFMKDPVRLKNFWRSISAEQLGYAPKAQWMATQSAIEGREDVIRKAHLSRDPVLVFNDEAEFGKNVIRMDPPVPQSAVLNEANVNAQDMKDVTGIHDASLGIKSNETSGRAIQARQREGDIASLTYYDNGNAAVLEAGDVINQLIGQVYDGTRTIRVIGEDEAIKYARINDPNDPMSPDLSVGQFDVAMTSGTSYTTRRVEAAQAMMEAVQVFPQLMAVAGDLIARAQDWPGADKIAERLEQSMQNHIDPAQMQDLQQQLQQTSQKLQALEADRSIEYEKLETDRYKAETERIRALSDNEVDATQMEQDAIKHILDTGVKINDSEHKAKQAQAKSQQPIKKA